MAIRTGKVAFNDGGFLNDPEWNVTGSYDPTVVGVVLADVLDVAGIPTGISLSVTSPFFSGPNQTSFDGNDHHGWPGGVWGRAWRAERIDIDGEVTLGGFNPGQQVNFRSAGHSGNGNRDTVFFANGVNVGTYLDGASGSAPNAPIEWTSTADASGNVSISTDLVVSYSYINAVEFSYEESATPPTSIDQLISGETSTATFAEPFAATSATVSDGTTSISEIAVTVDGNTVSFTAPTIADLATGLKLGNVSVTFTDGTDTTAGYSIAYQLSGYTAANITSVSDFALGVYFDPPTQIGDQFAYQADKGTVEPNGEWNDGGIDPPFVGTQTLWHYSSVDQTWRDFELTTTGDGSEPEPEPPADSIGMTRRNITRRASTSRTLTSRGMTS